MKTKNKKRAPPKKAPSEKTPEELAAERAKYVLEFCTKLVFIAKDGTRSEKIVEDVRMKEYHDLQRLLAKLTPRSMAMYTTQFANGDIITPETFREEGVYCVRTMPYARLDRGGFPGKVFPLVAINWEFYNYHAGAPAGWKDVMKERQEAKANAKRDEELKRIRDQEALELIAKIEAGLDEVEENNEIDWDAL